MSQGDPAAVRTEPGCPTADRHGIAQGNRSPVNVPDCHRAAGVISGRKVSSVRTESEHPDVSIALPGETGNFVVVAKAANNNGATGLPDGVTGHASVMSGRDDHFRFADRRAGRLHVRQRHAGDRLDAERIEPSGGESSARPIFAARASASSESNR